MNVIIENQEIVAGNYKNTSFKNCIIVGSSTFSNCELSDCDVKCFKVEFEFCDIRNLKIIKRKYFETCLTFKKSQVYRIEGQGSICLDVSFSMILKCEVSFFAKSITQSQITNQ